MSGPTKPQIGLRLWRITAPHFVAGVLEGHDGALHQMAPILRKSLGSSNSAYMKRWCAMKGYKLEQVS